MTTVSQTAARTRALIPLLVVKSMAAIRGGAMRRSRPSSVVAQRVDELVLRQLGISFYTELVSPLPKLLDRPLLVARGLSASLPDLGTPYSSRLVGDARGLLLRLALL